MISDIVTQRKSNLNRHIRLVHEGQKDHKCDICGKLYSGAVTLIRHKQSVHEGKKNHTCDTCGNCFSQNASLKRHIRQVHERRKDVKCDKCDKFFYSTVNLKQHNLQAHVKNNSHNCETCGKPYAEISELKRHMERNHSGNQLNCKDCGKTFPHEDALNKHINKCSKIVYDGKNIKCTSSCLQRAQLYKRYDFNCPIPQCQELTIDQPMPSIIEEIDFNPRDGVVPKGWRQSENPNFWSWENNKYSLNTNYYLPTEICTGISFP